MGSGEDRDLRWFCELTIFPLPKGEKEVRTPCGLAVTEIFPALTQFRTFPVEVESPEPEVVEAFPVRSVLRQLCWASSMMAPMEGVGAFKDKYNLEVIWQFYTTKFKQNLILILYRAKRVHTFIKNHGKMF